MKLNRILALLLLLALAAGLMTTAQAAEKTTVSYIERAWDDQGVTETPKTANCTVVDSGTTDWGTGWYAVTGNVTVSDRITVTGDVHLILCDDCTLTAEKGITVAEGNSMTIYGQSGGTGVLVATGDENCAGIGGVDGGYTATADGVNGTVVHRNSNEEWLQIEDAGDQPYHIVRRQKDGDSWKFVSGGLYEEETLYVRTIERGQTDDEAKEAVQAKLTNEVKNQILSAVMVNASPGQADSLMSQVFSNTVTADHQVKYNISRREYGTGESKEYTYTVRIDIDSTVVDSFTSARTTLAQAYSNYVISIENDNSLPNIEEKAIVANVIVDGRERTLWLQQEGNAWTAKLKKERGQGFETVTLDGISDGTNGGFYTPNKGSLYENWFVYLPVSQVGDSDTVTALKQVGTGQTVKNGELNGGYFEDAANNTWRFVRTADQDGSCGTITIYGGSVTAIGGTCGAGIGGGRGGDSGTVTICGGTVKATGGSDGAGIGGGDYGDGGDVTIWGGTVAAKGSDNGEDIGCGRGGAESGSLSHKHSFTYTLSDDEKTVIAYCGVDYCPLEDNEATVSIAKPEHETYGDGKDCSAIITGDTDVLGDPAVSYYTVNHVALTAPENAGKYLAEFTLGGPTAHVEYTITPAKAKITADANSKVYGETEPEFTAKVTGLVGTDTLNFELSRAEGENAGEYAITVKLGENPNYNVTAENGMFTITPAKAKITAENKRKVYGGTDPALTAKVEGTVGEDELAYTLSRAEGENAGEYAITVKLGENPNYNVTTTDGTFTITPAKAKITADAKSKVYGETDPDLTVTVEGAVGEDKLNYTLTRAEGENVGEYEITVTPGDNPNYEVSATNGKLEITKKTATVKADDKSKTYGETDPELTATVTGMVREDKLDYTLSRENGDNVGKYKIIVTPGNNPNYEVTATDGTFTVKEADKNALTKAIEKAEEFLDEMGKDYPDIADKLKEAVDKAKETAENKNVLPEEIEKAVEDLDEARELAEDKKDKKDFADHVENRKKDADRLLGPNDSRISRDLIADAKDDLDALEYDEEKSLEENKAAADAVIEQLIEDLSDQRKEEAAEETERISRQFESIRMAETLKKRMEEERKKNEPESEPEPEPEVPALPFDDVDPLMEEVVRYVWERGIMNGVSPAKFDPFGKLNRAMIVTILHRMEGEPATPYTGAFSDVPAGEWYTQGVEWAAKNGIVLGFGNGTYGPEKPVTREQLAAILYRYAQFKDYPVTTTLTSFSSAVVSPWATEYVAWAIENHILLPDESDGSARGTSPAVRWEVAAAVKAFLEKYKIS